MSNSTSTFVEPNQFAFGTRLGIFLSFEAALLSAVAVSTVLCYTVHKLIMKLRARQAIKKLHSDIVLPPIDATDSLGFVGLMSAELVQALGGLLNMQWVADGFIAEGSLCQAQGHLKQIGDVGVALFSLFIAFDTFFMLVFSWRASRVVSLGGLIGLCLFIVLVVTIGSGINHSKNPPYIGNTGYWCWITADYTPYRIALEYLWMWTAALAMLILYGIIALVMYGTLTVEGKRLRFSGSTARDNNDNSSLNVRTTRTSEDKDHQKNKEIARMMLFYPAIYIACVLPVSVVRWIDFTSDDSTTNIPTGGIIFASIVFQLSGFFNVLLFKFTRPALVSGKILDSSLPSATTGTNATASLLKSYSGHEEGHANANGEGQGVARMTRKRTGLGTLPEDVEMSPVSMTPPVEMESSAARYARIATASGTRPRTQESAVSQSGMLPDI